MTAHAERPPLSHFVDRGDEPSRGRVWRALAGSRVAWATLEDHLSRAYGLEGSFHYMYGPRYGWALRFQRGGRLVLAMYPNRGHLTVQVILGRSQVAAACAMKLPMRVARALALAADYPEGRWLFIPLRSARLARQLQPLLALKMSSRRRGGGGRGEAA